MTSSKSAELFKSDEYDSLVKVGMISYGLSSFVKYLITTLATNRVTIMIEDRYNMA